MSKLNPQQQAAVKMTDVPLLVLAGAGSGKTRVITEKIVHLIRTGTPARYIAAMTFTNKAAREMKSRLEGLLDSQQRRGLRVCTFHSLGLEILHKEYEIVGFKSDKFILFDESDKRDLLRNLLTHTLNHHDVDELDFYSMQIEQWKNAFIRPAQALKSQDKQQHTAALLYQHYERQLKAYNAADFDDLILLPALLLQSCAKTLQKWQNKIRYLLVDEYQDTNASQYQFVRLLAGNLGKFTVVGDDDQSIYAWRGASADNLAQLQRDYPRLKVIKLEQNYRSMRRILRVANHLIAHNPHVFEKRLWSDLGEGDKLRVLAHKNEQAEAQQIVSELIHHKFRHGGRYQDYAILYRGNHQARLFESCLWENSIPYFISGSRSFFSYSEIKDILSYLRLFVNSHDDAAFLRAVNTPRREIGPHTLEMLSDYANQRQISLFSACFEFGLTQSLSEKAIERLRRFCQWTTDTADKIKQGDIFAVLEESIAQIGYEQWLKENAKTPETVKRQMKNVEKLFDRLKKTVEKATKESEKSLAAVVSKVMLMDILERQEEAEAGDQVTLMTLHAAKGLEFPHVFLIGLEENLLPHQNSIEAETIEEERRLLYVGITRAQRSCTFSYCTHRKRYGEMGESEPSRFLAELPAEDLEWPQKQPLDKAAVKERGRANLSHLKTMLS